MFGQRVAGHVVRVAVRLAAVPEVLDQREDQRPLELVRVVRVQELRVLVEVDAAPQQRRVVHARHAEHGAVEVGRERGQRAAHDPALAVAVVEQARGVDHRLRLRRPCRTGTPGSLVKPGRVDHQPAQVHEVDEPLLGAVGERGEVREVAEDRGDVRQVLGRHAGPVGGAEHEVVLVGHRLDVAGGDLARAAEQAVAVERRPRGG